MTRLTPKQVEALREVTSRSDTGPGGSYRAPASTIRGLSRRRVPLCIPGFVDGHYQYLLTPAGRSALAEHDRPRDAGFYADTPEADAKWSGKGKVKP